MCERTRRLTIAHIISATLVLCFAHTAFGALCYVDQDASGAGTGTS